MMYRSDTRDSFFSKACFFLSLVFSLSLATFGLPRADDVDFQQSMHQPGLDSSILQNMNTLHHTSYFGQQNGYFFIDPDTDVQQNSPVTSEPRKTFSQHYANYNQYYEDINSDPWFVAAKKVAPFCVICAMFGVVSTVNLATLGLIPMYVISQAVGSIFNAGQDIGDAYAGMYGNQTGTATDASMQGLGHLAGGVTMGAIDLTLDMYFNTRIPNLERISYTETFSRFSKSVAITGQLNKALVAYLKDYLMTHHQIDEIQADAMAESASVSALSFVLSLATMTGIANSQYSSRFVDQKQLQLFAEATSSKLAQEVEKRMLQGLTMTKGQQFGRYLREEIPRASAVTAAYSTFSAVQKVCQSVLKEMNIGINDKDREFLCLQFSIITSEGASVLALSSEKWLQPGYLKVYFENLAEASGLGMAQMFMDLAGAYSEYYFPKQPLVRDASVMAAGTFAFSVPYGCNLALPTDSFFNNVRNGAHLMVVMEGTEVAMSHAVPILRISGDLIMEALDRISDETDLDLDLNLKSDLDTGYYAIPIRDDCMVMSLNGMTTESYGHNLGCNVPAH